MEQKSLARWLKVILAGIGLCGLVVCFVIIPLCGQELVFQYPEFSFCYYPWLIFLWVTGIPCYIALCFGWKITTNIGQDHSFTKANGMYLKWISRLAAGDSLLFFVGDVAFLFLNLNHPGVALMLLMVVFVGVAISVAAAALSHLVMKAAELQEQSDLTI